ncbi:MAG: aminodeoxychorismate synthase component I [Pseudomonadota bacterium]
MIVSLASVPDLDALAARHPERYPYLLKSVPADGLGDGFDILFCAPDGALTLVAEQGRLRLRHEGTAPTPRNDDFLDALNDWFRRDQAKGIAAESWPFLGGWFLYLGYELAQQVEPSLSLPLPEGDPVACAMRVRAAIAVRRGETPEAVILAEPGEEVGAIVSDCMASCAAVSDCNPIIPESLTEPDGSAFTTAVQSALEAISRGDIYQANLSRRWSAPCPPEAASTLFQALNTANPAPFSALARLPGLTIASSSPERLVHSDGAVVATRPIAGTRPRGATEAEDQRQLEELREHPKEQAEHVMLIDLERNDLGRVCRAGSVTVDEYMVIESYAFVHHIVSNIRGELADGVLPGDIIRAVFPGGTITGCPKVRCMALIAELEQRPRGAYTGSLGYLNRDGSMDLNILIRTLSLADGELSLGAGAGIVADSDPEHELDETRAKARGLLRAVRAASCAG